MLSFNEFLNEKNIELGTELEQKLISISDTFSKKLLDFLKSDNIKDEFGYTKIGWSDKDQNLLTITDEKGKDRKIKLGKLLKIIGFNKEYKDYEIENFISNLKTGEEKEGHEFVMMSGEKLRWAYNCENYADENPKSARGGLQTSCMRHSYTQDYLDIYTENPEQVQVLVLLKDKKVDGRALVWLMDNGKYFMDRVYTNNNEDSTLFKSYAEKNNILTKASDAEEVTLDTGGEFNSYPYMDTFEYYYPDEDILSTTEGEYSPMMVLKNTDGTAQTEEELNLEWSDYYGEDVNPDECEYVVIDSEGNKALVYMSDLERDYTGAWILKNNALEIDFGFYNGISVIGEYVDSNEHEEYYYNESENIILINGDTDKYLEYINDSYYIIINKLIEERPHVAEKLRIDSEYFCIEDEYGDYHKIDDTLVVIDEDGFIFTSEEPDEDEYTFFDESTVYGFDDELFNLTSEHEMQFWVHNDLKDKIQYNILYDSWDFIEDEQQPMIDGITVNKSWLENAKTYTFSNGDTLYEKNMGNGGTVIIKTLLEQGHDFRLKLMAKEDCDKLKDMNTRIPARIYFELDGFTVFPFDGYKRVYKDGEHIDIRYQDDLFKLFTKNENIMTFVKFKLLK